MFSFTPSDWKNYLPLFSRHRLLQPCLHLFLPELLFLELHSETGLLRVQKGGPASLQRELPGLLHDSGTRWVTMEGNSDDYEYGICPIMLISTNAVQHGCIGLADSPLKPWVPIMVVTITVTSIIDFFRLWQQFDSIKSI